MLEAVCVRAASYSSLGQGPRWEKVSYEQTVSERYGATRLAATDPPLKPCNFNGTLTTAGGSQQQCKQVRRGRQNTRRPAATRQCQQAEPGLRSTARVPPRSPSGHVLVEHQGSYAGCRWSYQQDRAEYKRLEGRPRLDSTAISPWTAQPPTSTRRPVRRLLTLLEEDRRLPSSVIQNLR